MASKQKGGVPHTDWRIQSCSNCGRHAVRYIRGVCEACGHEVQQ